MDKYIGQMLDNRYEIIEEIGVGGMAVVYKAKCHRLNRLVAVKILKNEYAKDSEFRRRFHEESQAVAMLSHPNIVSVYDVSRSGDTEYIVMELIDGITLKQYMSKKGVLSWREALHFSSQIVKALSHAHSRGIIHRDIKPHNIMILRDGSIRVADFGIARFTTSQSTLTQEALGSVHYISPEQARGSHIDARSDLYSLGVVMYEMLTGRLPYEGDSPVSVAIQHINSMPLMPREINPDIPEALEAITMRAMSANMSRRYDSADEMYKDLEEFRKNPNVIFPYSYQTGSENQSAADNEPTRVISISPGSAAGGGRSMQSGRAPQSPVKRNNEQRQSSRRTLPIALGVLAVLVVILGAGYMLIDYITNDPTFEKTEEVEVPNLLYQDIDTVRQSLSEDEQYSDIVIEEAERVSDEEYPEGTIIKQDPSAGSKITRNGTISVTISKGLETMTLPDLSNQNYRNAQIQLTQLGLNFAPEVVYEDNEEITADFVIRTEPAYGSTVKKGDYITLIVSKGAEVVQVPMPELTDLSQSAAERVLQSLNLVLGEVTPVDSDKEAGTVVWQSIAKGAMVDEKTAVDIQVSLGPSPTPSPSPSPSQPVAKEITRYIDLSMYDGKVEVTATLNYNVIYSKNVNVTPENPGVEIKFTVNE